MRNIIFITVIVTLLSLTPVNDIAAADATVTLLNGSGSLISGTKRYTLAPGYGLSPGNIIELNKNSMTQVEFPEGSAVALSDESRAMLYPLKHDKTEMFLMRGMVKASVRKGVTPVRIETPLFSIELAGATAVGIIKAGEAQLFSEVGEVVLVQGNTTKIIRAGEYCVFRSDLNNATTSAPPKSFVEALPVEFKNALPVLRSNFKDRNVPLAEPRDFIYKEVEEWIDGAPAVRELLVVNWKSKASDSRFRKSLISGLKKHPEWKEVLFPPKHRPKY